MARKNKPLPPVAWLAPRAKLTRALSLLLLAALTLLLLLWNYLVADLGQARPLVISVIELLPLLVLAPWIILGSAQAHAWLAIAINLYFIKGILAWFHPDRFWLGLLETGISIALFVSAMLYARWRSQLLRHPDYQA